MDNIEISQKIVEVLTKKNLTISCAESITAGLISSYLTSVAGASQVFKGGISAYQDEIKFQILNVDKKLIETKSSVCEEVAIQMAENIKNLMHADLGISTTGVAGPKSLKNIPVGTVFVAYVSNDHKICQKLNLSGTREEIREQTITHILQLVLQNQV